MIKLKSENGKCNLYMLGSPIGLTGDTITMLNAIIHGLHDEGRYAEAATMKETIKAWAEGKFDDPS